MIKVIKGEKGSGKSKVMVDLANDTMRTSKGVVVYIDHDNGSMFELDKKIRFINLADYKVDSQASFYGFICGMLSANYDIKQIFVDGVLSLNDSYGASIDLFLEHLVLFGKKHNIDLYISLDDHYEISDELKNDILIQN